MKPPLLNGNLKRMLLANFLCMAGSLMFFMLGPYLRENGLQPWGLGLSEGIFWAVSVLIQPWLGPNLDRHGRRPFFLLGAVLMSVAAAGFAFIPVAVAPVLSLRALQGAGFAIFLTASWSWVSDTAHALNPEKTGTIFGLFGLSSLLGSICGPGLAEFVALHSTTVMAGEIRHDYHPVFLTASAILGLGTLILLTLRDGPRQTGSENGPATHYFSLAKSPIMRSATCGSIGFGLAFGCISGMGAAYLTGLQLQGVAGMFACVLLAAAVSRVSSGVLMDRIGPGRLVIPSMLLLVVGIVGLGALNYIHTGRIAFMLISGLVAGLGYGAVYPALIALGARRMPPEQRGQGLSLITACIDLGNSSGAALAGLLATRFGYSQMFFAMGALVAVVSLLFGYLEGNVPPRPVDSAVTGC